MTVFRAARTLGAASGWTLSNLAMQKTLYIAQMIHLTSHGRPLSNRNRYHARRHRQPDGVQNSPNGDGNYG